MKVKLYLVLPFLYLVWLPFQVANAQTDPFQIKIEPFSIPGLPGIQSFAFGTNEGKWLILGGRLDGLHRRQPFASFDIPGHNKEIWVVEPVLKQKWSVSLSTLSPALQDQLSSTNMEFHQEGNFLYVIGGYGFSDVSGTRVTYDKLTAINVPGLMNAIVSGMPIASFFRQITHPDFAVTGGHLKKIYNTWYLVGGQKFNGNYNPMGNPTYTQEYTNAIRKFTLNDDGISLNINHLPAIVDGNNLHRRDYNVTPQIMPDGQEGLTAFSGVFQTSADIPYLNCVNIDSSGYEVHPDFAQYYNHYHCANLPLYSASSQEMHTIFFGGIAQYYESQGNLVQDNNVPFVKTIARVTRSANGSMTEYKLPVEMPGYLGSGSELILNPEVSKFENEVVKFDDFQNDTTLAGYIFGGISSSAPNIFFTNTGAESSASGQILKVFVIRNSATASHELNPQSTNNLQFQVFSNSGKGSINLKFKLRKPESVRILISDSNGKQVKNLKLEHTKAGMNTFEEEMVNSISAGVYIITIQTETQIATQKIVFKR